MTFKLERKSVGATLTKFHVLDSTGAIVGSINVANEQAGDLQKCWAGPRAGFGIRIDPLPLTSTRPADRSHCAQEPSPPRNRSDPPLART